MQIMTANGTAPDANVSALQQLPFSLSLLVVSDNKMSCFGFIAEVDKSEKLFSQ